MKNCVRQVWDYSTGPFISEVFMENQLHVGHYASAKDVTVNEAKASYGAHILANRRENKCVGSIRRCYTQRNKTEYQGVL